MLRAPYHFCGVGKHQHHGVSEQQLIKFFTPVETTEQEAFDQRAQQCDCERRGEHGEPEAAGSGSQDVNELPCEVGADHIEGAMRKIENAQDAENQRQTGGDKKQEHRRGKTAEKLAEQE